MQEGRVEAGQLADRPDAQPGQLAPGRRSDIEQVGGRQWPDLRPEIVARDHRRRIRLLHIAAELGKNLVETDANRSSQPQFVADPAADFIGDLLPGQPLAASAADVEPGLVEPERLDLVGVVAVDGAHLVRKMQVKLEIWPHNRQVRTFSPGLPERFPGDDAEGLGRIVLGQHDAVAQLRIAANNDRNPAECRVVQAFDRRIEIIQIGMQNHAVSHQIT